MKIDLSGRTAIVTGATGQLGRVISRTLAECGASVIIHYHKNRHMAEGLRNEIEKDFGVKAYCVSCDITDEGSVRKMAENVRKKFAMPDIVVNNAVIQYNWKTLLNQNAKDFYSQFESCVMHNVYMAKAFAPYMKENRYGRIVAINTECSYLTEPVSGAYASAKRGQDGIVRVLAKELGEFNITVNQVAPGWTITERDRENGTVVIEDYERKVPLKRRGTDQEVANMVAFLASDLAGFTTGAYVPVNGGRVMPAI